MDNVFTLTRCVTHQMYALLLTMVPQPEVDERDRGAVSLEQVLWFVAAGVAVAVIAGILWGKIKNEANQPVTRPTAP
jgi:hypothetical protein